jgi:hypothetical protein
MDRVSDSKFDMNPHHAFLEPAWAGNHVTEAVLLISDIELEYYKIPILETYGEAKDHAQKETFGHFDFKGE